MLYALVMELIPVGKKIAWVTRPKVVLVSEIIFYRYLIWFILWFEGFSENVR